MNSNSITMLKACRVCGNKNLIPILSFGDPYVSDFPKVDEDNKNLIKAPLELVLCSVEDGGCGLLQLKHTVDHDLIYRNYWYRSGINQTMRDELTDVVRNVEHVTLLAAGDTIIDIGSNDGTLLRLYGVKDIRRIGFEPARNIIEKYGRGGLDDVITDYFTAEAWKEKYGERKAKTITAIAMFYDLEDPNKFVADVAEILDPEGLFVIQMSYLPAVLDRNAFDGTCHEHLELYSLFSLENLLKRHNLEVFDVELRDINEGGFRIFIRHKDSGKSLRVREGAEDRLRAMHEYEAGRNLGSRDPYEAFAKRVEDIKGKLIEFIKDEVAKEKTVYIYGASTKGNTLLQYFGLDNSLIAAAAERNPDKWGRMTVGTNIPIISEEDARKANPDYFLVLPWQFLPEFLKLEVDFLARGGKFIVPLPEFRIVGKK